MVVNFNVDVNDDADVIFTVKFKALIHRPVKGEVQDGIVTKVDRVPTNFYISTHFFEEANW